MVSSNMLPGPSSLKLLGSGYLKFADSCFSQGVRLPKAKQKAKIY